MIVQGENWPGGLALQAGCEARLSGLCTACSRPAQLPAIGLPACRPPHPWRASHHRASWSHLEKGDNIAGGRPRRQAPHAHDAVAAGSAATRRLHHRVPLRLGCPAHRQLEHAGRGGDGGAVPRGYGRGSVLSVLKIDKCFRAQLGAGAGAGGRGSRIACGSGRRAVAGLAAAAPAAAGWGRVAGCAGGCGGGGGGGGCHGGSGVCGVPQEGTARLDLPAPEELQHLGGGDAARQARHLWASQQGVPPGDDGRSASAGGAGGSRRAGGGTPPAVRWVWCWAPATKPRSMLLDFASCSKLPASATPSPPTQHPP